MKSAEKHFLIGFITVILMMFSSCSDVKNDPEKVARAWIEALVAEDCDTANSYIAPNFRGPGITYPNIVEHCNAEHLNHIHSAKIDDVVYHEFPSDIIWLVFQGEFVINRYWGEGTTTLNSWTVSVHKVDGKWYVFSSESM